LLSLQIVVLSVENSSKKSVKIWKYNKQEKNMQTYFLFILLVATIQTTKNGFGMMITLDLSSSFEGFVSAFIAVHLQLYNHFLLYLPFHI